MANLTRENGDFTRLYWQHYSRDSNRDSDEDEEDDTLSLPSFSNSVRQQLEAINHPVTNQPLTKCTSLTSLKEVESQNQELRRENFDLKLRLYMRERQKNGIPKRDIDPEYESSLAQELDRKDNLIKSLRASLDQKEDELRCLKNYADTAQSHQSDKKDELIKRLQMNFDEKQTQLQSLKNSIDGTLKAKDAEINGLCQERDRLKEQLDQMNSGKENMGQAITRQLQKIEKLLEKTTLYVQEMN